MSISPAIANQSAAPLSHARPRPAFAVAFFTAAAVAAIAVALVTWTPAGRPVSDLSGPVVGLLTVNLLVILTLAALVGWRVLRLVSARRDAGVRLHLRFVALFATAAVVPAVLVALVFGLLVTRGVESWFSPRVERVVESFAGVGNAYIDQQADILNVEVTYLAEDLNRIAPAFTSDRATFDEFLRTSAEARQLDAIYILAPGGRRIAGVELTTAPAFSPPDASTWRAAETAPLIDTNRAQGALTGLVRLSGFDDAYVYAVDLNREVFARLIEAEQAVTEYSAARDNRERIGAIFTLSYVETALLVLVGAVWLGLSAAGRITAPMGRLVQAADRIAAGDLDARVETKGDPEEIAVVSHAFNRMTNDLQAQQQALRAAGEEAESRRNFIETVLSRVSAGVIGVDSEGQISAANRQALSLLHLEDDGRGRLLREVAPELQPVLERACATGRDAEDEVDLDRSGETRRLRARASGAGDAGLVLTFDDITRLIAAQRNAAWRDVARRIAHEIKNPLTPIQLSAERLRRKFRREITSDLETFDRCTDTIVRQVGDIGRMVDEFSSFARMPAPRFAPEDAGELLREAVFARRVASPELAVVMEEVVAPVTVTCDGRLIVQALANVLKNAAEGVAARIAREPDHPGRITARLVLDGDDAVFEVEDNGIGLPERDRDRLTEPYVTTREKGTGLGLAIVRRVLEDHGGRLQLSDSPELGGAKVCLRLPAQEIAPAAALGDRAA
jgi:two-component system nitrogen regulation sensor histidine kinase NtrY